MTQHPTHADRLAAVAARADDQVTPDDMPSPAPDAVCVCGHPRSEHFIPYIGCPNCDCNEYRPASPSPAHDTPAAQRDCPYCGLVHESGHRTGRNICVDTLRAEAADLRAQVAALHPLADMAAGLLAEKTGIADEAEEHRERYNKRANSLQDDPFNRPTIEYWKGRRDEAGWFRDQLQPEAPRPATEAKP